MPGPVLARVDIFRIPLVSHLKCPAKGILLMRNNEVMHVISHQRVRQELNAITLSVEGQELQVHRTVPWGEKYILTPAAALGDVMRQ